MLAHFHRWVIDVYRWPLRDLRSGDVGFYCSRCDAVRWNHTDRWAKRNR
jgi:hypothetical protein